MNRSKVFVNLWSRPVNDVLAPGSRANFSLAVSGVYPGSAFYPKRDDAESAAKSPETEAATRYVGARWLGCVEVDLGGKHEPR